MIDCYLSVMYLFVLNKRARESSNVCQKYMSPSLSSSRDTKTITVQMMIATDSNLQPFTEHLVVVTSQLAYVALKIVWIRRRIDFLF